MKIIVLAAGSGKRMWPIGQDKCLIPFLGKPLLYHNLKKIKDALNPLDFIIVGRPQSKEAIEEVIKTLEIKATIVIQNQSLGMADAILAAKDLIEGEILIVNAEDILDAKIFKAVLAVKAEVVVTGLTMDSYFPGGYIKATGNRVEGIVEKPGEGNEPSNMVKLVVDYFKDGKGLISYLEKAKSQLDDVYEVALGAMITGGVDIKVTKYDGVWIPLKYSWQILDITAYFLSQIEQQISPSAKVAKTAIIEGSVVIEEGVRVFEGVVIKGPCYIGKNCIVGNNSMV